MSCTERPFITSTLLGPRPCNKSNKTLFRLHFQGQDSRKRRKGRKSEWEKSLMKSSLLESKEMELLVLKSAHEPN